MKVHPILFSAPMVHALLAGRKTQTRRVIKPAPPTHYNFMADCFDGTRAAWQHPSGEQKYFVANNPHGMPGDLLWVRENFKRGSGRAASRLTLEITHVRVQRLKEISEADAMAEGIDMPSRKGTHARCGRPNIATVNTALATTPTRCFGTCGTTSMARMHGQSILGSGPRPWASMFDVATSTRCCHRALSPNLTKRRVLLAVGCSGLRWRGRLAVAAVVAVLAVASAAAPEPAPAPAAPPG